MKEHILISEEYDLRPESIDRISERLGSYLEEEGAVRHEVLRSCLVAECCLDVWRELLGRETECVLNLCTSFGRKYITLKVPGSMVDISRLQRKAEAEEEEINLQSLAGNSELLSLLGFLPEYHYTNGYNILKFWAPDPEKRKNRARTAHSIAIGVLILTARFLSPRAGEMIYQYAVDPCYTLFMRMISAVCGPMVLFSIITSICSMGDMASFGKVGASLVKRFLTTAFLLLVLAGGAAALFFPMTLSGSGGTGSGIQSLIRMIVEISPADVVSPFATGNALQIVFIGVVLGLALLVLSGSVPDLMKLFLQLQLVVRQVMRFLGRLMPYFMGVAILKLLLSCSLSQIVGILKPVLLILGGCFLSMAAETLIVARKTKTGAAELFKKVFPAALIALTTSSTSAALGKMHEDCTEGLGVDAALADFGIPFGQVIFKPLAGFSFFICALFAAESEGIAIDPVFLIVALLVSFVLGVSMAPIPGAMASCLSVLFLQLGIPLDYVALGVSIGILTENVGTMTNVQLLQQEIYAVSRERRSQKTAIR